MVLPPLNFFRRPKNLCKSSLHSRSSLTSLILSMIMINMLKMYEKMATPNISITPHTSLSKSLLGCKSPRPTVDSDVRAK